MINDLIEIAYTSRTVKALPLEQLNCILKEAREFNVANNITGLLLYKDGSFFQVIEGTAQTVEILYQNIQRDLRHKNVRTLYQKPLMVRNFTDWAMLFHDISSFEADGITPVVNNMHGYLPFDCPETSLDQWVKPSVARVLIEAFRHHA
ncbi:BLUF domain-containing protein [Thiomicrorhabdus aquaedulcis]|uniref:BLUF domain-containing protein n=1 Tax=Thiomicrorhabdus aquaedulcis TaxID=2211106 RepID=UPI000FDC89C7|nr:BLUF domain-containing protein [Thiomicrorhabdus aquaedulcis]